jgi:hypothetical protein
MEEEGDRQREDGRWHSNFRPVLSAGRGASGGARSGPDFLKHFCNYNYNYNYKLAILTKKIAAI